MCVCSLRYPACKAHASYCHLKPVCLYSIFPHYLMKGTTFVKTLLNVKCVLGFCLQLLSGTFLILTRIQRDIIINIGYTQKNDADSEVNKKYISHLTRAQRTPSAAATVRVSHALPAVRFSCLLRGQFPRWRRSRKKLSVCSVLRCPAL